MKCFGWCEHARRFRLVFHSTALVFSSAVVVTPRLSTLPTDFSQTPAACSRVYPRADVAAEASEDPDGLERRSHQNAHSNCALFRPPMGATQRFRRHDADCQ